MQRGPREMSRLSAVHLGMKFSSPFYPRVAYSSSGWHIFFSVFTKWYFWTLQCKETCVRITSLLKQLQIVFQYHHSALESDKECPQRLLSNTYFVFFQNKGKRKRHPAIQNFNTWNEYGSLVYSSSSSSSSSSMSFLVLFPLNYQIDSCFYFLIQMFGFLNLF